MRENKKNTVIFRDTLNADSELRDCGGRSKKMETRKKRKQEKNGDNMRWPTDWFYGSVTVGYRAFVSFVLITLNKNHVAIFKTKCIQPKPNIEYPKSK